MTLCETKFIIVESSRRTCELWTLSNSEQENGWTIATWTSVYAVVATNWQSFEFASMGWLQWSIGRDYGRLWCTWTRIQRWQTGILEWKSNALLPHIGSIGIAIVEKTIGGKFDYTFLFSFHLDNFKSKFILSILMQSATLFLLGILFFSGGCYFRALTASTALSYVPPVGGIILVLAWISLMFWLQHLFTIYSLMAYPMIIIIID